MLIRSHDYSFRIKDVITKPLYLELKCLLSRFRYYRRNRDVKEDKELQAFVNELSAKGTGPDGGNGKVIHFIFF